MAVCSAAIVCGPRRCARCQAALLLFCAHSAAAGFEYDRDKGVLSARLYGNIYAYAYYFTDLLVGSPDPQRASVIIDTGSRLVGFPCTDCDHCGDHLDPTYNATRSQSMRWQNCSAHCPDTCSENTGRCPYKESYAEGSEVSGFWFEDMVELGEAFSKNPPVRATLGCHVNENKLFYSQRANGIMGLAPSTGLDNQPSFLESMFRDNEHVGAAVFSICIANWGGRLNIGGYDESNHIREESDDAIKWVRLHASHYYYVRPSGLSLGGEDRKQILSDPETFGVTVVDSGTTFSYFPRVVYRDLIEAINDHCARHDCAATKDGPDCWQMSSAHGPSQFPSIQFDFDGVPVNWWAKSYLHQSTQDRLWCASFMEGPVAQTVLGISFMIHKDVIFDLAQDRMGLADADCPEYQEQSQWEQKFLAGPAPPRLGTSMHEQVTLLTDGERPRSADGSAGVPGLRAVGAVAALGVVSLAAMRLKQLRTPWAHYQASRVPTLEPDQSAASQPQADAQGEAA